MWIVRLLHDAFAFIGLFFTLFVVSVALFGLESLELGWIFVPSLIGAIALAESRGWE